MAPEAQATKEKLDKLNCIETSFVLQNTPSRE